MIPGGDALFCWRVGPVVLVLEDGEDWMVFRSIAGLGYLCWLSGCLAAWIGSLIGIDGKCIAFVVHTSLHLMITVARRLGWLFANFITFFASRLFPWIANGETDERNRLAWIVELVTLSTQDAAGACHCSILPTFVCPRNGRNSWAHRP